MEYQIQKPLKESKSILKKIRTGSPRTRHSYDSIIRKSIRELYYLKKPFNSVKDINYSHIEVLIDHWKQEKLSNGTIGNRLTILRKYLQLANHKIDIPSNSQLGFKKENISKNYMAIPENISSLAQHRITKLLIELQIHFGLTKSEAVKLHVQPYNNCKDTIFISKKISHCNRERILIVRTNSQKNILERLLIELGEKLSLDDKYEARVLINLYNAEITLLGHSSKTAFRSLYAKSEYKYLTGSEGKSKSEAIQTISASMHVSNKNILNHWISDE